MIKIEGLDKFQRELEQAQKALEDLDGAFGSVSFDPEDPASIDQAITAMENMIDDRVAGYENNSMIAPLAESMKEEFRSAILEKAAAARIGAEQDDADK